ncbi:helix-turn-helix transcriptional regulator [Paraburkholderia caffeinilytica]|uniref:helix-turn-helix transcriptional regulator n=1 Tax=Paraburkholderia caffeinilytica TaxID=1761016 RepID=UPI0038B7A8CC
MRLLHPDPLGRGNFLIGVRPKTLGAAIHSVGTSEFVSTVAAFVNESIAADAVHLERWRSDASSASGYLVEWLGSGGTEYAELCRLMDTYYQHYCHIDPLFEPVRGKAGTMLVLRNVGSIADGEFRRKIFDEPQIAHECALVHGTARVQYAFALARNKKQSAFTTNELFYFRQMAEMLFPLFELHARTSAVCRTAAVPFNVTPNMGFDERLSAQDVQLSRREYEICKLLLNGRTIPDAAEQLEIKLSTAESYVKRAFAKLGVRTKRELFEWALAENWSADRVVMSE